MKNFFTYSALNEKKEMREHERHLMKFAFSNKFFDAKSFLFLYDFTSNENLCRFEEGRRNLSDAVKDGFSKRLN